MKRVRLLTTAVSTMLAGCLIGAVAASAMDLSAMQDAAENNRAVVQRFISNVEKSEQDITLARGNYYPSVDLSYMTNTLDEPSAFEDSENSVAEARVSWNLFSGFRDKYNLLTARQLQEVEEFRLQGIRQDLRLVVALSYLGVYDSLANLKVTEDAYRTLERVYRDGENRYEVGLIGKNDLLKFRVDYDNADINMKAARARLDKSVNDLGREIGLVVTLEDLRFEEFSILPKELNEADYLERMLASRSEILALEGIIAANESQVQASYADYYPSVDLLGSYSRYDDSYFNASGDEDEEWRASLVLSLNVFRGFTKQAETGKAKLEKRGNQYELEELKATLTNDLKNLFIDYQISLENVGVARRSIEQAEENLRITQLKYDEGLERESDLLDAIASLSRAQANEVAVIRTVYSNYFQIQRMIAGF